MYGPLIQTKRFKDKEATTAQGAVAFYDEHGSLDSTGFYLNGKKEGRFTRYLDDSFKTYIFYYYRNDSLVAVDDTHKTRIAEKDESSFNETYYPGKLPAWNKFLLKNIQYPDWALAMDISGTVCVLFEVSADRVVSDYFLRKSVEYSLDEEALQTIAKSGKWIPAEKNGAKIKSYAVQPIEFKFK